MPKKMNPAAIQKVRRKFELQHEIAKPKKAGMLRVRYGNHEAEISRNTKRGGFVSLIRDPKEEGGFLIVRKKVFLGKKPEAFTSQVVITKAVGSTEKLVAGRKVQINKKKKIATKGGVQTGKDYQRHGLATLLYDLEAELFLKPLGIKKRVRQVLRNDATEGLAESHGFRKKRFAGLRKRLSPSESTRHVEKIG